jgi:malonyl-CoA decarboxylase
MRAARGYNKGDVSVDTKATPTDSTAARLPERPEEPAKAGTSHDLLARILGTLTRRPSKASGTLKAQRAISLCHALLSERGEVSGLQIAGEVLTLVGTFDRDARAAFFDLLVEEFSPNPEAVKRCAEAYRADSSQMNLLRLQQAVEPSRRELFRRLNVAREGIGALVTMRRQLLGELDAHPYWRAIDADFTHLFKSWFNRGFLELRQIDWRTSAAVLEKLIQYEAVHQIQGWHDLRRRLQADRRCYGFFHHALPEEPIIYIEVALTRGVSSEVQTLLDPDSAVSDCKSADSAVFYSITNCQEGLRGVSFGHLLIKQVVENLQRELPQLKTFATLSPIPSFRRWLLDQTGSRQSPRLARLLTQLDQPEWWKQPALTSALKLELAPLCAYYLLYAKRGKEPFDPVARFHLGNGARLLRLNWLSDTSPSGISRSGGLTVNYLYDLAELERNHEVYTRDFKVIASRSFERTAASAMVRSGPTPQDANLPL